VRDFHAYLREYHALLGFSKLIQALNSFKSVAQGMLKGRMHDDRPIFHKSRMDCRPCGTGRAALDPQAKG
jgi:hypothetical protein